LHKRIPQDLIEAVLEATDIVELVGQHVPLKRAGGSYRGLCPFHQENSPSFFVHPSKRIFKCFGCGVGGNAISFLMKVSQRGFVPVLQELGEKAGISVLEEQNQGIYFRLLRLHELAQRFFLSSFESNKTAQEYAKSRGLDQGALSHFGIGFAPDGWDHLSQFLLKHEPDCPPEVLEQSGLVSPRRQGGFVDRFRNRLMFPIRDPRSRVIAFGGRILPGPDREAKYLNSPETPLFEKGKTLYNWDSVCSLPKESRGRRILVVEGYLDAISLWQQGFLEVVAPLGTGFTPSQVKLLEDMYQEVQLVFDGDLAGSTATLRAVERMVNSNMIVRAIRLPEGMDPQEYLQVHGPTEFRSLLANASNALRFYCEEVLKEHDLEERQDKERAWRRLVTFFQGLNRTLVQGGELVNEPELVSWLTRLFSVDEKILRSKLFSLATGGNESSSVDFALAASRSIAPQTEKGLRLLWWANHSETCKTMLLQYLEELNFSEPVLQEYLDIILNQPKSGAVQILADCGNELGAWLSSEIMKDSGESEGAEPEALEYFSAIREYCIEDLKIQISLLLHELEQEGLSEAKISELQQARKAKLQKRNQWILRKS